jgi:RimJ/RimL family protein N-acetyltransferase
VFATERLIIEPLEPSHAPGLHAALDHPDVGTFIGGPDVTTLEAVRARIERLAVGPLAPRSGERWWNFAVLVPAERTIIGRLEATTYGAWGEIAYVFSPSWWGRGLASEASRWLVGHLAERGVPELWAAVDPDNDRSQRLLLRIGFTRTDEPERPLSSFLPGDDMFVRREPAAPAMPSSSARP